MKTPIYWSIFSVAILPAVALGDHDITSLLDMPLQSLVDTKVVSATKTSRSLADIAAAVYVITAKEINRSGARSVADALSLAPGLHVAKFSNYDWGISARGSNEALTNNLLVMVDGRSVYNPMFSGVDWDLIPVSIDNIEKIEIVLGPVGTIWGGNAVNGVINIITMHPEQIPARQVQTKIGNYDYKEYQVRGSTRVSDDAHLSGYAEFVEHMPWTSKEDRVQSSQHFKVYTERFGTYYDLQQQEHTLNIQVGGIRSREDYNWLNYYPHFMFPDSPPQIVYETEMTMEEYFAGIMHIYDSNSNSQWENQLWLTYSSNDNTARNAQFFRTDLETRYINSNFWDSQITIGANVRLVDERLASYDTYDIYSMPYVRTTDEPDFLNQTYAVYANWSKYFTEEFEIMLGSRWQYSNINDGVYAQPQVRLNYHLSDNQRLWFGWGKAIVTPSRLELSTDFQENGYIEGAWFNDVDGNLVQYDYHYTYINQGNEDLHPETVETFELGYRFWDDDRFQLSVNAYFSQQEHIRANQTISAHQIIVPDGSSEGTLGTILEKYISRQIDPLTADTVGGEISMKWQVNPSLQINANYSYKYIKAGCVGAICSRSESPLRQEENQPNHSANAQMMWDINPQWWVSSTMQYVAKSKPDQILAAYGDYEWPNVFNLDAAISWQQHDKAPRFTLVGESLTSDQTQEYPGYMSSFNNGTQYWLSMNWAW